MNRAVDVALRSEMDNRTKFIQRQQRRNAGGVAVVILHEDMASFFRKRCQIVQISCIVKLVKSANGASPCVKPT